MGKMENVTPDALAGATGAKQSGQAFRSAEYRLRAERATSLCMCIADMPQEDAAPILWAALDDFHRQGLPESPLTNLMSHATEWASWATENELKAYAVAAARRMNPSTREAFALYLRGCA
jgi:hypothetical protein